MDVAAISNRVLDQRNWLNIQKLIGDRNPTVKIGLPSPLRVRGCDTKCVVGIRPFGSNALEDNALERVLRVSLWF